MTPSLRSLLVAVAFFFTLTLAALAQEKRATSPAEAPPVAEASSGEAVVTVFSDALLEKDKKAEAVVAVFGKATADGEVVDAVVSVFGDNRVTGPVGASVVAVFGNSYVNSTVKKSVVVVFGDLELGPDARIDGEVVCIAGSIKRDGTAVITGQVRNFVSTRAAWLRAWLRECFLKARPLAIGPNLGWAWAIALSFLALYALAALLFRAGVAPTNLMSPNQPYATSEQRPAFRHPHDGRAGDLVVPRLAIGIEDHPNKAEAAHDQRKEATQSPHGSRGPIDFAIIEAHNF